MNTRRAVAAWCALLAFMIGAGAAMTILSAPFPNAHDQSLVNSIY